MSSCLWQMSSLIFSNILDLLITGGINFAQTRHDCGKMGSDGLHREVKATVTLRYKRANIFSRVQIMDTVPQIVLLSSLCPISSIISYRRLNLV